MKLFSPLIKLIYLNATLNHLIFSFFLSFFSIDCVVDYYVDRHSQNCSGHIS